MQQRHTPWKDLKKDSLISAGVSFALMRYLPIVVISSDDCIVPISLNEIK